jgi:hypothetical protein
MHIAPYSACTRVVVTGSQARDEERSSGLQSSLLFTTSYAKLRIAKSSVDSGVQHSASIEASYELTCPEDHELHIGTIRVNRSWREAQAEDIDLDFIVIRATPCADREPFYHSNYGGRDSETTPGPIALKQWSLALMCVDWLGDQGVLSDDRARRAERFAVASMRDEPSAEKWLSVRPKPVEVLVELM